MVLKKIFLVLSLITLLNEAVSGQDNAVARSFANAGMRQYAADSLTAAEHSFSLALKADSNYDEARYQRAKVRFDLKRYQEAFDDYAVLIFQHTKSADVYGRVADILHMAGKNEDALEYYRKAIVLDSTQGYWQAAAGSIYFDKRQYPEAIRYLEKALSNKYQSALVYGQLGYAWSRNNDNGRAVIYLTKAIALDPSALLNYAERGFAFIEIGQPEMALPDLEHYLEKNPNDVISLYNLARAHYALKDLDTALHIYYKVLKLQPGYLDTYFRIALIEVGKQNYMTAANFFTSAIQQSPGEGYLYYNRAVAELRIGKRQAACDDLKKALELKYNDARPMYESVCSRQ